MAPKAIRDDYAALSRIARRRGWTNARLDLCEKLWERGRRAIAEGTRLDESEINKLFGWAE